MPSGRRSCKMRSDHPQETKQCRPSEILPIEQSGKGGPNEAYHEPSTWSYKSQAHMFSQMQTHLGPPLIRFISDSLRVRCFVRIKVRSDMWFLVMFMALLHARGDRVDWDCFSHDESVVEKCTAIVPLLFHCEDGHEASVRQTLQR